MHSISRRSALTGAAAIPVAVAAPAVAGDHPDAELIALWHERQRVGDLRDWHDHSDEALDARGEAIHEIGRRIVATPAHTLEGLAVKVRLFGANEMPGNHVLTQPLYQGLLADIERLNCVASEPMTTREDELLMVGGSHV